MIVGRANAITALGLLVLLLGGAWPAPAGPGSWTATPPGGGGSGRRCRRARRCRRTRRPGGGRAEDQREALLPGTRPARAAHGGPRGGVLGRPRAAGAHG